MAFSTAAGYANLPSGNFVPAIYSQKVLKFFRRAVQVILNHPGKWFCPYYMVGGQGALQT